MKPSVETCKALVDALTYDPETGEFRWRANRPNYIRTGRVAGSIDENGYSRICFKKKNYFSHRLAWLFMTGEWPVLAIDHKNMVKHDNRFSNLRLATIYQNSANRRGRGRLPKGVARLPSGKFQAQIKAHHRNYYLGSFGTPEEAGAAYEKKAVEIFGEFARAR